MAYQAIISSPWSTARAPAWFRYGVIALATLVLCSCRSAGPVYRVADGSAAASESSSAGKVALSPTAKTVVARKPPIELAAAELPTHLTPEQLAQATCLPEGFVAAPCDCSHGGCGCCNNGPVRGPNDEYLCDGGDYGLPVGVRANWQIDGLEQEDTIAHYDTIDGRTVVTPSNKVCIYAPRFAAIREVVDPRGYARIDQTVGAVQNLGPVRINENERVATSLVRHKPAIERRREPPSLLRERRNPGELGRMQRVEVAIGSLAPYANLEIVRVGVAKSKEQAKIARASLAAITWAGDQAAQVMINRQTAHAEVSVLEPGTLYSLREPNNPRLRLIKLASTDTALPGEEVEFTLRYDNVGDRVIGNVTIVDSLTTRLEFVPESQKSSLEANFSTTANEVDSAVLRWEILAPLKPGEGGVLQFKARVR